MRRINLVSRPQGDPVAGNFAVADAPTSQPGAGQLLTQTLWLSVDPYVRLTLDETTIAGMPGLPLGESPIGRGVSRVITSNHPDYHAGDIIEGRVVWAEEAVIDPVANKSIKLDFGSLPLSYAVGALGMPGQTAYAGMIDVGKVKEGETVLISAAAGAVGSMAGQIGKLLGAKVVGIAGGAEKCAQVEALGFDACVDYRAADFEETLAAAVGPRGFNVYFENVGGDLTRRVLHHAAYGVRVPLCGVLAAYTVRDENGADRLPEFMRLMFTKGVTIQSFFGEMIGGPKATAAMREWIVAGKLTPSETILDGLDALPEAFAGISRGNNHIGKVVVKIAG